MSSQTALRRILVRSRHPTHRQSRSSFALCRIAVALATAAGRGDGPRHRRQRRAGRPEFQPPALRHNFAALNPARGFSKIFGFRQSAPQLLLNLLKVTLVALVGWSAIAGRLGQIIAVQQLASSRSSASAPTWFSPSACAVGILLLILAILDYIYQRFRIERSLRMTKQEVKDEMRSMEGDPV